MKKLRKSLAILMTLAFVLATVFSSASMVFAEPGGEGEGDGEPVRLTYTIYWDDNNNADGMRPDEVIVGVADGYDIGYCIFSEEYEEFELRGEGNTWVWTSDKAWCTFYKPDYPEVDWDPLFYLRNHVHLQFYTGPHMGDRCPPGYFEPSIPEVRIENGEINYSVVLRHTSEPPSFEVAVPPSQTEFVYDGAYHYPTGGNGWYFPYAAYRRSHAVEGEVGKYTTTIKPLKGYRWSDGTTEPKTINWEIKAADVDPIEVVAPTNLSSPGYSIVMDGKDATTTFGGHYYVNTSKDTITPNIEVRYVNEEGTAILDPSNYTVRYRIRTSSNNVSDYYGDDFGIGMYYAYVVGNTEEGYSGEIESIPFQVNLKTKIAVPTCEELTYNGEEQTGVKEGEGYSLSGTTKAINAGSYHATATPGLEYIWEDDSTEAKTISWEIGKASAEVNRPEGNNLTYNGEEQIGVAAGDYYTLSGTIKATEVGTYNATATLVEDPNITYTWDDGSTGPKTINWEIKVADIEPIEVVAPTGKSLTYNGKNQTGVEAGEGYTLSGTTSATNAGSYQAKATLIDGYVWSDGKTEPKTISWKINKATVNVTTPAGKTFTYNGKSQTGVAAGTGYSLTGTVKATSAGSYTAKATLKSDANYIYKWSDGTAVAKTIKWTINKAANPLTIKAKTATVKYSKVKKKAQTLTVGKVIAFTKKGQGKTTYTKASGNKKIVINKTTGKVTVKKGLKKGTYKVKVKVKAAGNANYNASGWKTVTIKIKIK